MFWNHISLTSHGFMPLFFTILFNHISKHTKCSPFVSKIDINDTFLVFSSQHQTDRALFRNESSLTSPDITLNETVNLSSELANSSLHHPLFDPINFAILTLLSSLNLSDTQNATNNTSISQLFNDSSSESRTISNWLGLKRFVKLPPIRNIRPYYYNRPPVYSRLGPPRNIPPPPLPPFMPNFLPRPDGFPGPNDPDSVVLPPSMFEDAGINYWLKFIENGGVGGHGGSRGQDMEYNMRPHNTNYNKLNNPRRRKKPNYSSKPIGIGEKPITTDAEFLPNEPDDDDYDEPKGRPNNEHGDSHGSSSFETHKYDTTPRCDKFTPDICVDDFEYPEQAIVDEIYKRREIFQLMYSEVKDNVPMVDGIPRDVEESYSYENYYYNNNDYNDAASSASNEKNDVRLGGGFVCPSEVLYGKPKLARNKNGDWKVIVNAAEFTQTVRMERCLKPNNRCDYIPYPQYNSRCAQIYSFHRLMVFEKGKGFYMDTFRIPTACTCYVTRRATYKPLRPAPQFDAITQTLNSNQNTQQKQPALSNTLWSILGAGNSQAAQSNDLLKSQISLINQLKHIPQFSAQISPEKVLKQLMDLQSTSTYSDHQKQSAQQSSMEYLMPSVLTNQQEVNHQHQTMTRPQMSVQTPSPMTATYVHPSGMNGNAPIVQVIHVPVSSAGSGTPSISFKSNKTPPGTYSGYSYVDAESLLSNKPQVNGNSNSNNGGNGDNGNHLLIEMSSKPNSTLLEPSFSPTNQEEFNSMSKLNKKISTSEYEEDKEVEGEDYADKRIGNNQMLNRKMNFSYHPILEYIS